MTEQDLTKKIIRDANKNADAIRNNAKAEFNNKVEQAKLDAEIKKAEALEQAKKTLLHDEEQQKKANEVELIKARINAKQNVMDKVFNDAKQNLINADQKSIEKIVNGLIKKYASPDDTILVSKEWAKSCTALKSTDAIHGGIIIENKIYRMELSVDVLLDNLREKIGLEVAKVLGVM